MDTAGFSSDGLARSGHLLSIVSVSDAVERPSGFGFVTQHARAASDRDAAESADGEGVFKPVRRSVLIGASALAVTAPAKANHEPTRNLSLDFLEQHVSTVRCAD